jgi:hypothetical protein
VADATRDDVVHHKAYRHGHEQISLHPPGGLTNYYRNNNVIGGPGAFVMVARNFNSFGDLSAKKLITEIAQLVPQQRMEN